MSADLVYLVAGAALLLAIVLPGLLDRLAISTPIVLIGLGIAIGLTPLVDGLPLDPTENQAVIEHVTELVILVALMGVGLALDRPLSLRDRASFATWSSTWRLLLIAMPLTIAGVAALGWAFGLAPAAAILLGAVLAPTDPVLASDVQVAGPRTGDDQADEPDEVRFTLTSEAGLNDGLAFPFVYLAIFVATEGTWGAWLGEWFGFYVVAKIVIGVVAGLLVGRALAFVAFRARSDSLRVAERGESLLAVAALISAYGVGEVAAGYGFLSVFVCAMTFRAAERSHEYHDAMHQVTERLERLLTLLVLLFLGIAVSRGLLAALDWRGVVIGLLLILAIRPLAGVLALGVRDHDGPGPVRPERAVVAFFGVRGIGSLYYLAYAVGEVPALGSDWLWATVAFTVVASVVIHGVASTPVIAWLDRTVPRRQQRC